MGGDWKMKIALMTDTYVPQVNGVARTLNRFVGHLEHRGIEHHVFVPKCSDENLFENNIHRFTSLPFFLYPECRIAIPNYLSIKETLQRFAPDILHVATPFNIGLCGLHHAKKHRLPLVASYHTHFDRYLQYYHLDFLSKWIWRYLQWFHEPCELILVPSEETKRELTKRGFANVDIWTRGVDCHQFNPGKRSAQVRLKYKIKERYIFLYVGRVAPEKDIDILLDTIDRLPDEMQKNIHWLIVGDGPALDDVKKKQRENMTCTGYLEGDALAEIYASSDLFVFPSSTETFGNVVLEAMASGLPVVGAKAGGVQELVAHERNGWLCEPRNADAFVDRITRVLKQPKKLTEAGKNGRQYALTRSWEHIFDQLLLQYEYAIQAHRKREKSSRIRSA